MSQLVSLPLPRLTEDLQDQGLQDWVDDITKYLFDLNQQLQGIINIINIGLTTTQTFKDGSGATKTMTLVNGKITKIA